jgi:hypothetical protein
MKSLAIKYVEEAVRRAFESTIYVMSWLDSHLMPYVRIGKGNSILSAAPFSCFFYFRVHRPNGVCGAPTLPARQDIEIADISATLQGVLVPAPRPARPKVMS